RHRLQPACRPAHLRRWRGRGCAAASFPAASAWDGSGRVEDTTWTRLNQRSGIMSSPQTGTRTRPAYNQRASGQISRMAIWSLVLSILTLGGIGSIAGIWLGVRVRQDRPERRTRPRAGDRRNHVGVITLLFAIGYWIVIAK